jgi:ribosomal protein L17
VYIGFKINNLKGEIKMAEEQKQEKIDFKEPKDEPKVEKKEEKAEEKEVNYEEIASSKGWKPKNEYDGPAGGWIGAEEFVKREPLFERIKGQTKSIKEMQKTIEAMATHFQKDKAAAIKKAVDELKSQRREAIKEGDVEKVEEIDKNIVEHEQAKQSVAEPQEVPQVMKEWLKGNDWFDKDMEMRIDAIAINQGYLAKYPNDLEGSLRDTDVKMRKLYPDKFKTTKKETASPVESPSGESKGGNKHSISRLSPDQKLVYEQMVKRHKIVTHEQYFNDLEEIGELK